MKLEFNFHQSGVVPYRKRDNGLEIMLITTTKKKRWIIPKGYVEFNLTDFESAKKEAFEEAGIIGANETIELGSFDFKKSTGPHHMRVYSMEVIKTLEEYPEKNTRNRKWFPIKEAEDKVEKRYRSTITKLGELFKENHI